MLFNRIPEKWSPKKMVPGKMIPQKNGPGKNGPEKNCPRKIGPRQNGPRNIGPRKNVLQKLFSVKKMLGIFFFPGTVKNAIEQSHSRHIKLIFICNIQYIHIYYMILHLQYSLYFPKMF